jgi:hypothetical protein
MLRFGPIFHSKILVNLSFVRNVLKYKMFYKLIRNSGM